MSVGPPRCLLVRVGFEPASVSVACLIGFVALMRDRRLSRDSLRVCFFFSLSFGDGSLGVVGGGVGVEWGYVFMMEAARHAQAALSQDPYRLPVVANLQHVDVHL